MQTATPKPTREAGTMPLRARGLARSFGSHVALAPFDVEVARGSVTGLLGPNGSGKSTFMRCLVGLVPRDEGRVWIDGIELAGEGANVRERATYAPGELHLYGELTGAAHLAFLLRGRAGAALTEARRLAEELGLPLGERVRGYSHGMKRQLVFAAVMAPDVPVRILDEISEGLDPAKRSEVLDHILADARRGRTILLSSHHLGEVDRVCDRLLFLSAGRLIADESAADVARRSARLVALQWADAATAESAAARFRSAGVADVRVEGRRTVAVLESDDPRAFLALVADTPGLGAPVGIEHGRMSLADLYRDLYGVEGT